MYMSAFSSKSKKCLTAAQSASEVSSPYVKSNMHAHDHEYEVARIEAAFWEISLESVN
jgi:hypothetical protein